MVMSMPGKLTRNWRRRGSYMGVMRYSPHMCFGGKVNAVADLLQQKQKCR